MQTRFLVNIRSFSQIALSSNDINFMPFFFSRSAYTHFYGVLYSGVNMTFLLHSTKMISSLLLGQYYRQTLYTVQPKIKFNYLHRLITRWLLKCFVGFGATILNEPCVLIWFQQEINQKHTITKRNYHPLNSKHYVLYFVSLHNEFIRLCLFWFNDFLYNPNTNLTTSSPKYSQYFHS